MRIYTVRRVIFRFTLIHDSSAEPAYQLILHIHPFSVFSTEAPENEKEAEPTSGWMVLSTHTRICPYLEEFVVAGGFDLSTQRLHVGTDTNDVVPDIDALVQTYRHQNAENSSPETR